MKHCFLALVLWIIFSFILIPLQADEYLIKPGDSLGVNVLGEPDLTKRVVVDPQGGVTLPLINGIHIAGLTTTKASDEIKNQLKRFLKNPIVNVELVELAKMLVTISGEVKNPGIYQMTGEARLMDAITMAGGYTLSSDLTKVAVSHASGTATTVDLSKFLVSGDPGANVIISVGDTIVVPGRESAAIGTVTVLGAVRQAGPYPITRGMTIREAVTLAGGPTEFADLSSMTLKRAGSIETILIDYTKAVGGDVSTNPELKPGDVIFIAAREQLGFYTIQGAVATSGKYELRGKTSITEAIAIAGGAQGRAKLGDVRILRTVDGAIQTMHVNAADIMKGKTQNFLVQNGDNVFVPAGKQSFDVMRILSLAVSLGWLLTSSK